MKSYFEEINNNVYAFLQWDDSWNSFNNCYVLIEDEAVILIDSGKEEHFKYLQKSLNNIGLTNDNITKFIATHGHRDHIGGCEMFHDAKKFIHYKDLELLSKDMKSIFTHSLPDKGIIDNSIECVLFGHHTKGSVALFHHKSEILFCGDHLCFFGETLPNDRVIVEGKLVREKIHKFILEWSENAEMREKHNFDLFIEGLQAMLKFKAKYLCTGHGVIIRDDINEFISDIIEIVV